MRANVLSTTLYKAILVLAVVLVAGGSVFAATESQLRERAKKLEVQVNEGKKDLHHAHKEVTTLQGKVDQLTGEINELKGKIAETNSSIESTEKQLVKTEKELKRQEEVMSKSLRVLYKYGDISTVELLASSESFTQFVNGQEYLARIKLAVQESAEKVATLRDSLEERKQELTSLLELHTGQQKIVASKRAEQNELLDSAKDKEFSYKQYVASKQKQQREIEDAVAALIRSQITNGYTSQGKVNSNSIIGYTGSTGNSSGAHLHFSVFDPAVNDFVNPLSGGSMRFGFAWPYNASYPISRGFGCSQFWAAVQGNCPAGQYMHRGVDVAAPAGTPIRAIGPGDITCKGNCIPGAGYAVVIRHNNGLFSHYYHMLYP